MPRNEWRGLRVIAALTLAAMTALAPGALAQQTQGGGGPSFGELFDLFAEGSPDPNPQAASALVDAARKARAPGECPLGALFIHTRAGDPLLQEALAAARRQVVLQLLNGAGIEAGRFFVDSTVHGAVDAAFLQQKLDRGPPTLHTTSVPAKGSKVKAGDKIVVTMVARDEAEPKPWQTGIKTIQLVADSEDGRFVASKNYGPCADGPPPPQRRVVATYVVPQNPPPVVRLSALAEDHAGLMDTDAAEFPTGDWIGRIEWSDRQENYAPADSTGGKHTHSGYADFSLRDDGAGNLTGDLVGSQSGEYWYGYAGETGCTAAIPPTPITAKVTGAYTPGTGAMSIQFVDLDAKVTQSLRGRYGTNGVCTEDILMDFGILFAGLARSLQSAGDGSYRAGWDGSGDANTSRWSLTLRRTAE